jgi:hypothetical protein
MAKSTNGHNSDYQPAQVVGKTLWDILEKLFSGRPLIIILTLAGVILLFLILTLTGLLKFQINDGKLSLGFNAMGKSSQVATNQDDITTFCLTQGTDLKKRYVIKSVIQAYNFELFGEHKDSLLVRERIIYDLIALRDISKAEDVFKEGYSSNVAKNVLRWFGNDREESLHMGNQHSYYVHFDCKRGDSHTIITGADFYYFLPLADSRYTPFRDTRLAANEDLWIYPNEEDVIGKLTMIISSDDIKFKSISNSALHTTIRDGAKLNDDKDAFYNFDENQINSNNSVSYTWSRILPDEQFALKIKW